MATVEEKRGNLGSELLRTSKQLSKKIWLERVILFVAVFVPAALGLSISWLAADSLTEINLLAANTTAQLVVGGVPQAELAPAWKGVCGTIGVLSLIATGLYFFGTFYRVGERLKDTKQCRIEVANLQTDCGTATGAKIDDLQTDLKNLRLRFPDSFT